MTTGGRTVLINWMVVGGEVVVIDAGRIVATGGMTVCSGRRTPCRMVDVDITVRLIVKGFGGVLSVMTGETAAKYL